MVRSYSSIKNKINYPKIRRQVLSHVKAVRIFLLALLLLFIFLFGFVGYKLIAGSIIGTSIGLARDFIIPSDIRIKTSNDRINVLLLGVGGAGHDAPDLTDTMILASISPQNHKMTLVSVPRDIWINDLKDKINSAFMYGKAKQGVNGGFVLAKSTMEQVLGVQINYVVLIDFGGFKNVIDAINGITVNVQNGFTDSQYPIAGRENDTCNGDRTYACRYMTVTFKPGVQTMDGETALEFVRSRHANGTEGSDIARETRQQLVISAIPTKLLNLQTLSNVSVDNKLIQIAQKTIQTDMYKPEEATLARYMFDAKNNMTSQSIPDNLLYNPTNEYKYFNSLYTHAFVFIPNNKQSINGSTEDWTDIHKWVQTVLP
jgi:polyisoprenyl-teichoic acid--peptidoglycan teichoic acid transferase